MESKEPGVPADSPDNDIEVKFAPAFDAVTRGTKQIVWIFDQDRTVSVPAGPHNYQKHLVLHPRFLQILDIFIEKGGVYVPSSARSIEELEGVYDVEKYRIAKSGNDGWHIRGPDRADVFFNEQKPDYSVLRKEVAEFIEGMKDVEMNEMEAYFQLLVDDTNPLRDECESFFCGKGGEVEARSGGLSMVVKNQSDCLSMEPKDNRGKADAINVLLPMIDAEDAYVIVAGDGANDVDALDKAKREGHMAVWINKGGKTGVPDHATHAVNSVDEFMAVVERIVERMPKEKKQCGLQ
ncbi:unnamed protein product [Scytosiphon promiscuus]